MASDYPNIVDNDNATASCDNRNPEVQNDSWNSRASIPRPPRKMSLPTNLTISGIFESRNALFKHINTACEDAKNGTIRSTEAITVKDDEDVANEDVEICLDGGCSRACIDRGFLSSLNHSIEHRNGKVRGIGKSSTSEWATFDIYVPGFENGEHTMTKFTRSAWIIDSLPANLLLGADFLDPYKAVINYENKVATLKAINFDIPFQTRSGMPCTRKVKTTRSVTLLPNQEAYVAVDYRPLPTDRSFAFNSSHPAALNGIVDAKTPKVVALKNPTEGMFTVSKRYPIGRIEETKIVAISLALDSTALAVQATALSVSTEFDLDERTEAIANERAHVTTTKEPSALTAVPSDTPVSDYVFGLTKGEERPLQSTAPQFVEVHENDDHKPIFPEGNVWQAPTK
ncbi:hypothetical protein C8A03DRAFT_39612, partial [Achaetomium macrosporum]